MAPVGGFHFLDAASAPGRQWLFSFSTTLATDISLMEIPRPPLARTVFRRITALTKFVAMPTLPLASTRSRRETRARPRLDACDATSGSVQPDEARVVVDLDGLRLVVGVDLPDTLEGGKGEPNVVLAASPGHGLYWRGGLSSHVVFSLLVMGVELVAP